MTEEGEFVRAGVVDPRGTGGQLIRAERGVAAALIRAGRGWRASGQVVSRWINRAVSDGLCCGAGDPVAT